MAAWENEVVMRDVTNAGLVVGDRIGREMAAQLDLEEALEASRYSSHPYSTHPREVCPAVMFWVCVVIEHITFSSCLYAEICITL